jgi:hypothetical protein
MEGNARALVEDRLGYKLWKTLPVEKDGYSM